ncbi:MAG: type II toxin-antitoxin system RelE/ParE family toxin [Eubacterium sp.]|nr:type II toxin-antitoxin system RelE/ParE family toxin [Eubacterium sp.]
MKTIVLKSALKDIKKLDSKVKERIKKAIENLPSGDIKALKGHKDIYRLRIGKYRVIFEYDKVNKTFIIYSVRPRGNAYNDLQGR